MVVESNTIAVLTAHAESIHCSAVSKKAETSSIRGEMRGLLASSRSLIQPPLQGLHTLRTVHSGPTCTSLFLPTKPVIFVGCIFLSTHSGHRCSLLRGRPPQKMHTRTVRQRT